ncbi:hypothetical protein KIMH_13290 [Bombiscardovia apis]|uniref:Uncharacterized protein n=1 Tax=Bombiscardovia apis TaxID=2932182 RepID=A0ABM8BEA7_9BIFI|nr:three component ABC system middle component [Bombiscardovia apis]BDR55218.1 hypothetical protein KIMH_13290 [Bombiscardovia apis]
MINLEEAEIIQNPAHAAILLYGFTLGYTNSGKYRSCPLSLIFLAIPILLNDEWIDLFQRTQKKSGLSKIIGKITKNVQRDNLLNLSNQSKEYRELTLEALRLGFASEIFVLSLSEGAINPNMQLYKRLDKEVDTTIKIASKIGLMFSDSSLLEIQQLLKVRL